MNYEENQILLSALNKKIHVKKQNLADNVSYNVEVSKENSNLMNDPLLAAYLYKLQNFPAFFARILANEYSLIINNN